MEKIGETKRCRRCGGYYVNDGHSSNLCHRCRIVDNEDFEKVRDYLYENGAATAIEIEKNTGIPIKQIEGYLKEGRLEIPANSPIFIKCENCGKEIRSGRYCDECSAKISKNLNSMMKGFAVKTEENKSQEGHMYYFNSKPAEKH